MALDVKVEISLSKPVGSAGTWIPAIYVTKAEGADDSYAEYRSLDELAAASYTNATSVYKAANLIFMQENAPEKIAVIAGGESVTDTLPKFLSKNWRQLIILGDFDEAVAEYIETTQKMYFAHFATQEALAAAYAKIKEFNNTACVLYTDDTISYPEAAVVGATAGLKAGSFTYKNMILKGVPALDLSDTEIEAVHANGGITILEKAGDIVTSEGIAASGQYIDEVDSDAFIVQNISYRVQKTLNTNNKVPYTDKGISLIELAVLEVLKEAYNNGMIAEDENGNPAYGTNFVPRSYTTESDRAERNYPYGQFWYERAGAIHKTKVIGEVTA